MEWDGNPLSGFAHQKATSHIAGEIRLRWALFSMLGLCEFWSVLRSCLIPALVYINSGISRAHINPGKGFGNLLLVV